MKDRFNYGILRSSSQGMTQTSHANASPQAKFTLSLWSCCLRVLFYLIAITNPSLRPIMKPFNIVLTLVLVNIFTTFGAAFVPAASRKNIHKTTALSGFLEELVKIGVKQPDWFPDLSDEMKEDAVPVAEAQESEDAAEDAVERDAVETTAAAEAVEDAAEEEAAVE